MKARLLLWSLTSALAGFIFGFDTIVISGGEQTIQLLWGLGGDMHGWVMSAALWGTVLGAMLGGWPTNIFGRRKTLLSVGILYFVSAIWSALSYDPYSFMVARFVGGLGIGISTVAAPLYISEISPPKKRGWLAGLFQFNIVFGILVAFLSNALFGEFLPSAVAWRWMLGIEGVPALIYSLMCFGIPESPRWLIVKRNDREAGERVLRMLDPEAPEEDITGLATEIEEAGIEDAKTIHGFWSARLRVPILLAFLVAFFNQLSGVNVILYYAPRLLGLAGIGNPLLAAVAIGVTNLIFTFIGLRLIDRLGRKTLLFIGSLGYILSLGVCAWAFLSFSEFKVVSASIDLEKAVGRIESLTTSERVVPEKIMTEAREGLEKARSGLENASRIEDYRGEPVTIPEEATREELKTVAGEVKGAASELLGNKSVLVLACILLFMASHAVGQGAVIWVFIAEIFPNAFRAPGQSLGSFTHWIFAALLTLLFPIAIEAFDAGFLFLFFCGMMVLQLVWVIAMVPETKGVPLEEMEKKLGVR